MKLVIDCRMHHLSGIGRYIKDIVPSICDNYEKVVLIGDIKELSIYKAKYKSVEILEMAAPIYSLKEQVQLSLKVPNCDIFISPHFNVPLLPIRAKKRVVTIHDAYHLAFYDQLSLPQKIYAKLFFDGALKRSDKVITISQFSKGELLKFVSEKYGNKIKVIYRFVGDVIKPEVQDLSGQAQDLPEDFLLYVGNVKPHKNLKNALAGFKLAINNTTVAKNVMFKIVGKKDGFINGDKEIQEMVENDVELQQRVQFTGHITDEELGSLYKHAICLVFPSFYEGFGLPPLEAMYFGCPTICSKAASIPEICGDATLYFDPSQPNEIANKMVEIISSPMLRKSIKEKGYDQVRKYNKVTAIEEHLKLFDELAKS